MRRTTRHFLANTAIYAASWTRDGADRGGILMNFYYPYSMRAIEAKADKAVNFPLTRVMAIVSLVASLGGGILCLTIGHSSIGWILVGLAAIPTGILIWGTYELKNVPIGPKNDDINDVLSNECLVRLGQHPTPKMSHRGFI